MRARTDDQLIRALLDISEQLRFCARAAESNGDKDLTEAVKTCAYAVTVCVAMCAKATIRVVEDAS